MATAVEVLDSVDAVAEEWDRLVDRVGGAPFHRPGWVAIWSGVFAPGAVEVFAARRHGRLVAVVPVVRRRGVTRAAANEHTPESCLLAEDPEAAAGLARGLFAGPQHRVSLALVDPGRPGLAECRSAAAAAGYRAVVTSLQRSPYVSVRGPWDDYERGLSANLRKDVRRRRRRLEELGQVVVEVLDGRQRLDELLEEGFRVEGANWKGEQGTAIRSGASTRRFYTEVARWAAARGWLRLAFLRVDGRAVAFEYALEHGGVFSCVKGGYDAAYDRFSPGKVLSHALLERAFARGLARFDLLGADEPYKQAWADTWRDLQLLQAFAPSLPGLAGWAAFSLARPAADHAGRILRRAARAARPPRP